MTRFVVRPTTPYVQDGYSVVDTAREDADCSAQIGRGLANYNAHHLRDMLTQVVGDAEEDEKDQREALLSILAACADAHDDYLPADEKRANREAHEKNAEQTRKMPAALRDLVRAVMESCRPHQPGCPAGDRISAPDCECGIAKVVLAAREALGE